tara:strand:- start:3604 stop:4107 length:504 start_codon:yes stop_codon:yes gene_type:complete
MINKLILNLPSHIASEFYISKIEKLSLSDLKVKVTNKNSRNISTYLSIKETPHFSFVESYISGKKEKFSAGYRNYKEYNYYNEHHLDEIKFQKLIDNIICNGFNDTNSKIVCLKNFYNPLINYFKVLDGSHRLAVISFLQFKSVDVAIANHKNNFFQRKLRIMKNSL